jgi:malate synthase
LNTTVPGKITEDGVRGNVAVALAYSTAWVGGNGCIPVNYLMEDAATAEIARVQLWQWVKYGARMDTGEPVTVQLVDRVIAQQAPSIKSIAPGIKEEHLEITTSYLKGQIRQEWPSEFLTSDLMPILSAADGVEEKWQKSVL